MSVYMHFSLFFIKNLLSAFLTLGSIFFSKFSAGLKVERLGAGRVGFFCFIQHRILSRLIPRCCSIRFKDFTKWVRREGESHSKCYICIPNKVSWVVFRLVRIQLIESVPDLVNCWNMKNRQLIQIIQGFLDYILFTNKRVCLETITRSWEIKIPSKVSWQLEKLFSNVTSVILCNSFK